MKHLFIVTCFSILYLNCFSQSTCKDAYLLVANTEWQEADVGTDANDKKWFQIIPPANGYIEICQAATVLAFRKCYGEYASDQAYPYQTFSCDGDRPGLRIKVFMNTPIYLEGTVGTFGDSFGYRYFQEGNNCLYPQLIDCGETIWGTTFGLTNNQEKYEDCTDYVFGGEDKFYKIYVPDYNDLFITLLTLKGDNPRIFVSKSCSDDYYDPMAEYCVASDTRNVKERILKVHQASGYYYIIIDYPSFDNDGYRNFEMKIECGRRNPCENAYEIECGKRYLDETTIGHNSNLNDFHYPTSCEPIDDNYDGNDRIYKIYKPSDEGVFTVNLFNGDQDLDLFILNKCDDTGISCCGINLSDPIYGHNHKFIVKENFRKGYYYVVVDGSDAYQKDDFSLTVTCGELNCDKAELIECGRPKLNENNYTDENNVSAYYYNDRWKAGYTGDEKVYYFELEESTEVDIQLFSKEETDDFDFFIFNSCDAKKVLYRSNANWDGDRVQTTLKAGQYYIVVDGFENAQGAFDLYFDQTCCLIQDLDCDELVFDYIGSAGELTYNFKYLNSAIDAGRWLTKASYQEHYSVIGTGPETSNTFAASGKYTVCFEYDNAGCPEHCCKVIFINDPFACTNINQSIDSTTSTYTLSLTGVRNSDVISWRLQGSDEILGSDNSIKIRTDDLCDEKIINATYYSSACDCYKVCSQVLGECESCPADPLNELQWLQDTLANCALDPCGIEVFCCIYQGQPVFNIQMAPGICTDTGGNVYDAAGNKLFFWGGIAALNLDLFEQLDGCNLIYECSPEPEKCCSDDPLNELQWLQDTLASCALDPCGVEVFCCIYQGQPVFNIQMAPGICSDTGGKVYDCEGNELFFWGGIGALNLDLLAQLDSCELIFECRPEPACCSDDPLLELRWLIDIQQELDSCCNGDTTVVIEQGLLDGKCIFKVPPLSFECAGISDDQGEVYDCEGNIIFRFAGLFPGYNADSLDMLEDVREIWRCGPAPELCDLTYDPDSCLLFEHSVFLSSIGYVVTLVNTSDLEVVEWTFDATDATNVAPGVFVVRDTGTYKACLTLQCNDEQIICCQEICVDCTPSPGLCPSNDLMDLKWVQDSIAQFESLCSIGNGCSPQIYFCQMNGESMVDIRYPKNDGEGCTFLTGTIYYCTGEVAFAYGGPSDANMLQFGNLEACDLVWECSVTTGISEAEIFEKLALFPNPNDGQFRVDIYLKEVRDLAISIRDIYGRNLQDLAIKNVLNEGIDLDLRHLPNGIYLIHFNVEGQVFAKKFIKNR